MLCQNTLLPRMASHSACSVQGVGSSPINPTFFTSTHQGAFETSLNLVLSPTCARWHLIMPRIQRFFSPCCKTESTGDGAASSSPPCPYVAPEPHHGSLRGFRPDVGPPPHRGGVRGAPFPGSWRPSTGPPLHPALRRGRDHPGSPFQALRESVHPSNDATNPERLKGGKEASNKLLCRWCRGWQNRGADGKIGKVCPTEAIDVINILISGR